MTTAEVVPPKPQAPRGHLRSRYARPPAMALQVGEALRTARHGRGLTLLTLAKRLKTTPQTVQRLEAGTMTLSVDWIERFCIALEIEPGALFPGDPSQLGVAIARAETAETELAALRAAVAHALELATVTVPARKKKAA